MTGYVPDPAGPPVIPAVAVTITLAGHDLNDGTTYRLLSDPPLVIPGLAIVFNELVNYDDGSSRQVNVRPNVGGNFVTFSLAMTATSATAFETAISNLNTWVSAGGALIIMAGTATLLSCTVGVSPPPAWSLTAGNIAGLTTHVDVSLERLT